MFLLWWLNYVLSLPPLFWGITNFPSVVLHLLQNKDTSKPVILDLRDGTQLKAYTAMDVWTVKEIYLNKDYEKQSVPIENGWTVLDIGAGLGDFSVSVAKRHPKSRVYAYEPNPKYFKLLEENVRLNNVTNVRVYPLAIGARAGKLSLYVGSDEAVTFSTASILAAASSEVLAVPAKSLETIFQEEKLLLAIMSK